MGCVSDLKSSSCVSQIQLLESVVHWMARSTAFIRAMWDKLSVTIPPKW
jgi:hypothetical protein